MNVIQKFDELGLTLPTEPQPAANYVPWVISGDHIYLAGQTPKDGTELVYSGQLGSELTTSEGYQAARLCILRSLSAMNAALAGLNRVEQIVKLTVFVNADAGFTEHPKVADGASDLLGELFGVSGQHCRTSVGVSTLPGNASVEVDLVARVRLV